MQGLLHTATVQRGACALGTSQATMAIGEQQLRVSVGLPETAQAVQSDLGQGHKAVAVTFGVTHVDSVAHGINIGHLQSQVFAQVGHRASALPRSFALSRKGNIP